MTTLNGDDLNAILMAVLAGGDLTTSGVPDSPEAQAAFAKIANEVQEIQAAGQSPEIPFDHPVDPGDVR